jgi:hypothetical protein
MASSSYYTTVWTDSHCMIGCWHEHAAIEEAMACMPCAGGYVVAVEDGVMRALTPEEDARFESLLPVSKPVPLQKEKCDVPPRTESEEMVEFVMRWMNSREIDELEKIYDEHAEVWLRSRRKRS